MRRSAILQRLKQKSKLDDGLILPDAKQIKHFALDVTPVNTNTATADLTPVEHHVIRLRPYFERIGVEQS